MNDLESYLFTAEETSHYLSISVSTFRRIVGRGHIPKVSITGDEGAAVRYRLDDVRGYAEQRLESSPEDKSSAQDPDHPEKASQ